ncbi:MAG: hypothetical protein RLZZ368_1507 [Actinomycetota bacterium]
MGGHQVSRIAIYNLYWATYGGAEQVSGAFAEFLRKGHEVTLLGPDKVDVVKSRDRLGLDLTGCEYLRVVNDEEASEASAEFDVFINGTYRSRVISRAARGVYYVHFPQPLDTSRQRVNQGVSRTAVRTLALAPGRLRSSSKFTRIHKGFERRVVDSSWIASYTDFVSNSEYTARWTQEIWGVPSTVVYPAVRPVVAADWARKTPSIATLGRFFDPIHGHGKKQRDLVDGFVMLDEVGRSRVRDEQWRFVLVGGADAANREYALSVKRAALGHPIDVHLNRPRSVVEDTLAEASIYWHGTGYGEVEAKHPERFEHFGIAVVEAMLAGCVPVVYGEAGPAEIVRHGVDGYHWHTLEQLAEFTYELMADPAKRRAMAESAVARGREYSIDRFRSAIDALL